MHLHLLKCNLKIRQPYFLFAVWKNFEQVVQRKFRVEVKRVLKSQDFTIKQDLLQYHLQKN